MKRQKHLNLYSYAFKEILLKQLKFVF